MQIAGAVYIYDDGEGMLAISGSSFNANTAGGSYGGDAVWHQGHSPEYYTNDEANAASISTSG